jgi:hypothetical protein
MTPEKSSKRRKRANEQDLLRTSLSLGYQQIVPTTQSSARNHSKGKWQPLVLGLLISGGLSANAQAQKAPRAALVATPNAQIQKVPRATLVATPNGQMQRAPRATLVATPSPTPAPVVVTTPTPRAMYRQHLPPFPKQPLLIRRSHRIPDRLHCWFPQSRFCC